jgi:RNase P subunit RPR2
MKEKSIVDTIAEMAAELPKRDLRALERKDIAMMKALEQQTIARVKAECHPDVSCPNCNIPLIPEHAHSTCPKCHYRDSCCF